MLHFFSQQLHKKLLLLTKESQCHIQQQIMISCVLFRILRIEFFQCVVTKGSKSKHNWRRRTRRNIDSYTYRRSKIISSCCFSFVCDCLVHFAMNRMMQMNSLGMSNRGAVKVVKWLNFMDVLWTWRVGESVYVNFFVVNGFNWKIH